MHASSNSGHVIRWYFAGGFALAPIGARSATIYRDTDNGPVEAGTTPIVRGRITPPVF